MKAIKFILPCFLALIFLLMTNNLYAEIFIVDDFGDVDNGKTYTALDGTNTLRKCIRLANNNAGGDIINFRYSGTISPVSELPEIDDDETVIDASSRWIGIWPYGQPGITIDGSNAPSHIEGLYIDDADDCHIRGLVITGFDNGIEIGDGAKSNVIGGNTEGTRNVISGNRGNGVLIVGTGTDENIVCGNYIGTDTTGQSVLANEENGVRIRYEAKSNIIGGGSRHERNIISGNYEDGVEIYDTETDGNIVSGNYIGIGANGSFALGNGEYGVDIQDGAQSIIGGKTEGRRNVISANNDGGVNISGSDAQNNKVCGNHIGTNANGTYANENFGNGVSINDEANNNIIGGATIGERNLISGNDGLGVEIDNEEADNNIISGNYIGTDVTGYYAIPNAGGGIAIKRGAKSNVIGGEAKYAGNTIAYNNGHGVLIDDTGTEGNRISRNSMFDNDNQGIYLSDGGNDVIDEPDIDESDLIGITLNVSGDDAGANATVEIFKADSSSGGEGKTYLGSLIADASGDFDGSMVVDGMGVFIGDSLVATTTHTDNNTSEFSRTETVYSTAFDVIAPARVTDLAATIANSIELTWTAPGDNGNTGTADEYIIRYYTETITDNNWNDAWDIENEPEPSVPGTEESMIINMPYTGLTYYFALKTQDEVTNRSLLSNSASATEGSVMQLYSGWNLVSMMCMEIISIDDFLAYLPQCTAIWAYEASTSVWMRHVVGAPEFLNTLDNIGPGYGYWIDVTEDCSWDCGSIVVASPSSLKIQRPPFLLYGKVGRSERVSLKSGDKEIAGYNIGPDPKYADYYVLEVPVDGDLHEGDAVQIYANGIQAGCPIELGEMGVIRRHDLTYMQLPNAIQLHQNFPNPFNPETWIPYQLIDKTDVTIRIYDIAGQIVRTLNLGQQSAGFYTSRERAAYWDGKNDAGEHIVSGVYFYSINAGEFSVVRKMTATR